MSFLEVCFFAVLVAFSIYSGMILGRFQTNTAWEYHILYHNSAKVRGDNYLCKKFKESE